MSSEDNNEVDNVSDFGSVLSEARTEQNYSISDINENIKIPIDVLSAIEACDMEALPASTFTQGYIRSYARFLEISEDDVLALYYKALPDKKASDYRVQTEAAPKVGSKPSAKIKIPTTFIFAVIVIALFYVGFQYSQNKTELVENESASASDDAVVSSSDTAESQKIEIRQDARLADDGELIVGQVEASNEEKAGATSEEIVDGLEANTSDNDPKADAMGVDASISEAGAGAEQEGDITPVAENEATSAALATQENEESQVAEPDAQSLAMDNAAEDSISFYAQDGAWIEVWDANGVRLLYNMLPEGGHKTLQGRAPFSVSMGNAITTRVEINNIEIDFAVRIRTSNTVKFKVSNEGQEVIFH